MILVGLGSFVGRGVCRIIVFVLFMELFERESRRGGRWVFEMLRVYRIFVRFWSMILCFF